MSHEIAIAKKRDKRKSVEIFIKRVGVTENKPGSTPESHITADMADQRRVSINDEFSKMLQTFL